ncbi:MAG: YceD family protein [Candidatus Ornithomonoglobus sp.]
MLIDLSSIIKVTGAKLTLDGNVGFDNAQFLGETYRFPKPLKINGEIYNNGKSLVLDARVTGSMKTECARCLKEIDVDVDYDIHELLSRVEDGADPKDEDIILFEGYEVELDDIAADNFLMNVSGRYLCREDCKGLCPECGHDLNEGDCGCDRDVIDPRWQALADILNQQKNSEE